MTGRGTGGLPGAGRGWLADGRAGHRDAVCEDSLGSMPSLSVCVILQLACSLRRKERSRYLDRGSFARMMGILDCCVSEAGAGLRVLGMYSSVQVPGSDSSEHPRRGLAFPLLVKGTHSEGRVARGRLPCSGGSTRARTEHLEHSGWVFSAPSHQAARERQIWPSCCSGHSREVCCPSDPHPQLLRGPQYSPPQTA